MLQRLADAFRPYPRIHDFVVNHVQMQFEDVGAMLRLPIQAYGIINGCNFAAASTICNLLSGISVTIFEPGVSQRPDKHGKMQPISSGEAFREFVKGFYPDPSPQRRSDIAGALYRHLRNPFAHALGVLSKGTLQLAIKRVTSPTGDGLTQAELKAIEESSQRSSNIPVGVQGSGGQWDIIVDFLYRDALDMMVSLAQDATQMQKAEARFEAGTYVWRS